MGEGKSPTVGSRFPAGSKILLSAVRAHKVNREFLIQGAPRIFVRQPRWFSVKGRLPKIANEPSKCAGQTVRHI